MAVVPAAISVKPGESIDGPDPDISFAVSNNICPNVICRKTIFSRKVVEMKDGKEFVLCNKWLKTREEHPHRYPSLAESKHEGAGGSGDMIAGGGGADHRSPNWHVLFMQREGSAVLRQLTTANSESQWQAFAREPFRTGIAGMSEKRPSDCNVLKGSQGLGVRKEDAKWISSRLET